MEKDNQKRALAIHDISCFGRCSLTVALPILSAAGIETAVLPTAVLSTHTGGFTGYTFHDMTREMMPTARHWKKLGIEFDALYTGYLGGSKQISVVSKIFDMFGQFAIKYVDPVMGDNGKLYDNFPVDFPSEMYKLCTRADIILPNLTEAALLVQQPPDHFLQKTHSPAVIQQLLKDLADICNHMPILTGVSFEQGKIGAAAFDKSNGKFYYAFSEEVAGMYHGTGDIFSSVVLAGLLRDYDVQTSLENAVEFVSKAVMRTQTAGTDIRFGVNFEESLKYI
ncbi:MAG: pyridoxamine kinase [Oscillospiraceae bacterium]|jgi:pyridoxine kinase|nr:pyridoxamine kinase [Oscillospiraceae bacterium]